MSWGVSHDCGESEPGVMSAMHTGAGLLRATGLQESALGGFPSSHKNTPTVIFSHFQEDVSPLLLIF